MHVQSLWHGPLNVLGLAPVRTTLPLLLVTPAASSLHLKATSTDSLIAEMKGDASVALFG